MTSTEQADRPATEVGKDIRFRTDLSARRTMNDSDSALGYTHLPDDRNYRV